jgi:hypothetical protein
MRLCVVNRCCCRYILERGGEGRGRYSVSLWCTALTVMWMMAKAVAMGGTTSVLQYGDYCMPPWVADLMVFMMTMGDGR